MRLDRRTRLTLRLQHGSFLLLLIALCAGLAWFTSRLSWTADWTASGRNSLTAASRRVVRQLKGPVSVLAFAREDPTLRSRIRHLVDRYRRVDPKIRLRFVNPDIHLAEVRRLGIRSEGELDLAYGRRHQTINTLDQRAFTDALLRLERTRHLLVTFVTGHGERSFTDPSPQGLSALAAALRREGFRLTTVTLARRPIPRGTSLLVVAEPRTRYLSYETQALLAYLKRGGNLLWLAGRGRHVGLAPLARRLGFAFLPGHVVDVESELLGVRNPTWLVLTSFPPTRVTRSLSGEVLDPDTTALAVHRVKGWMHEALFTSPPLPLSWLAVGSLRGPVVYDPKKGDRPGPLPIAELFLHGRGHGRLQRVAVLSGGELFANGFLNAGDNLGFALNLFNWLSAQKSFLNLHQPPSPDRTLVLSQNEEIFLAALFLVILPLFLVVGGLVVRLRRARR
jgi:hypothetical protein